MTSVVKQFSDYASREDKSDPFQEDSNSSGPPLSYSRIGNRDGGFNNRDRPFSSPVDLTPNPSIYVGNLVFDVTADDLKREFSSFGEIKSAIIATDGRGLSKGFGYIEFDNVSQAEAAIQGRNQTVFEGRRLIVNFQAKSKRAGTENPPSKTLFVGNLAFEMTDSDLNKLFREIRNVVDVRVAIDRRTGQPRGFAHADFISVEDAVKAKELLTDRDVYGRKLRVDFSAGVKGNPGSDSTN